VRVTTFLYPLTTETVCNSPATGDVTLIRELSWDKDFGSIL